MQGFFTFLGLFQVIMANPTFFRFYRFTLKKPKPHHQLFFGGVRKKQPWARCVVFFHTHPPKKNQNRKMVGSV